MEIDTISTFSERYAPRGPWREKQWTITSLSDQSAQSPWAEYREYSIAELLSRTLGPVKDVLPKTVEYLATSCVEAYVIQYDGEWYLAYWCGSEQHTIVGGLASASPILSRSAQEHQWSIPDCLLRLYAIHDGLGPLMWIGQFWQSNSVIAASRLWCLGELGAGFPADPKVKAQDILMFMNDGSGNGQCFVKSELTATQTFDWDHEARELSKPVDFWQIVDHRLATDTWWL